MVHVCQSIPSQVKEKNNATHASNFKERSIIPDRLFWCICHMWDYFCGPCTTLYERPGKPFAMCPGVTAGPPAAWAIRPGRHLMLEIYTIRKDVCGIYGKPQKENHNVDFLEFWSKAMPSATKNWTTFKMQLWACYWALMDTELYYMGHQAIIQ